MAAPVVSVPGDSSLSVHSDGGSRPIPDPTELTDRAIAKATLSLATQINDLEQRFADRLDSAKDREAEGFRQVAEQLSFLNRERSEQFAALKELMEQKIGALQDLVAQQFDLAERQRVEQKNDTKQAVDAALTAQKEAVKEQTTASALSIAKSETATNKQLEQQQAASTTATNDLRRSIDELKERLGDEVRQLRQGITDVAAIANGTKTTIAGATEQRTETRTDHSDSRQGLYVALSLIFAGVMVFIGVLGFVLVQVSKAN